MADSKKYDGSQWEHSLRKLTTATEAVENPLYSDGTAITAYTLKGNTVQNGTPTPSNPVDVNGVGVRTENLSAIFSPNTASSGGMNFEGVGDKLRLYGDTDTYVQCINTNNINLAAGTYTISASSTRNNSACYVQFRSEDGTSTYATIPLNSPTTVTFNTAVSGRIRVICQASTYYNTDEIISIMINEGSTAKPYEPYGYKIPISSGGVTTNIYLSEPLRRIGDYADTIAADGTVTRVIKTYKITGQENWGVHGSIASWFFADNIVYPIIPTDVTLTSPTITSHFKVRAYANAISISNGECTFGHPSGILTQFRTILKNTDYTTVEDFTDWLKAQYNNGNPVTIWYASDTPTTETTTALSIPTTEGANSITVDTTVQPSEFTATWTGWHDASVKEWDGSEWNE